MVIIISFYNRKPLKAWKTLKVKLAEDTIGLIDTEYETKKDLHIRQRLSFNKRIKIEHPDIADFYEIVKEMLEK